MLKWIGDVNAKTNWDTPTLYMSDLVGGTYNRNPPWQPTQTRVEVVA